VRGERRSSIKQAGQPGGAWERCASCSLPARFRSAHHEHARFRAQTAAAARSAYRLALLLRELRLGTRFEPCSASAGRLSALATSQPAAPAKRLSPLRSPGRSQSTACQWTCSPVAMDAAASAPRALTRMEPPKSLGDEPLLIARQAGVPVYVAGGALEPACWPRPKRPPAFPLSACPPFISWTTAFNIASFHRDVDILLLDGRDWVKDGLLPAGNLREPVAAARRATVIAIPAPDGAQELEAALRTWGFEGRSGGFTARWRFRL